MRLSRRLHLRGLPLLAPDLVKATESEALRAQSLIQLRALIKLLEGVPLLFFLRTQY